MIYSGSRYYFLRFEHMYMSYLKNREAAGKMKKEEEADK